MKRFLVFIVLIISILALASCDMGGGDSTSSTDKNAESSVKVHTHVYDEIGFDDENHYSLCTVDGCNQRKNTAPHRYVEESVVTLENTHSADGIKERKCEVCEHRLKEAIPAGHNFEELSYLAPTCISEGRSSYVMCKECRDAFKDTTMKVSVDPESMVIATKPHTFENAIVTFVAPTVEADGKIEIKCSACNTAPNAYNTIPLPITFDSEYYSWSTKTDPSCEEDGNITYQINRSKVISRLTYVVGSDYKDELAMLTEQNVFETQTLQIKATGHDFTNVSLYRAEFDTDGFFTIGCKNLGCFEKVCFKDGEQWKCYYGKYDPSNTEIFELISDTSSCVGGTISYKLKREAIEAILNENYELSTEQIEAVVQEICTREIDFSNKTDNHDYVPIYNAPTADAYGNFQIKCTVCEGNLTHGIYTESIVMIPKLSDSSDSYSVSTTSYCDRQGVKRYDFTSTFIENAFKTEYYLNLTDEEIERYCSFLKDGVEVATGPIGHSYKSGSAEVILPTYNASGSIKFKCLRDGCSNYFENASGSSVLELPMVQGNLSAYTTNSEIKKCFDFGSVNVTVNSSWLRNAIDAYSSQMSNFKSDTALLGALKDFDVQTSKLTTHSSGMGTNNLVFDSSRVSNGKVDVYCYQCKETVLVADVLPINDSSLTTRIEEGDCATADIIYYYMSEDNWLAIVKDNPEALNDRVSDYVEVAKALSSRYVYAEKGNTRPGVHTVLTFDNTKPYSLPSYDPETGVTAYGSYYRLCYGCQESIYTPIYYSSGEWVSKSNGYVREYAVAGGKYLYDETVVNTWSLTIMLDDGVTINTTSFSQINTIPCNASMNNYFRIDDGDFNVNGSYKSVKSISIYLDGKSVSEETMIELGLLEKGTTLSWWKLYLAKNKDGVVSPGNISIRLNFDE